MDRFTFLQFIRKPNDRNRVISTDKAVLHFSKVCSYRRKSSRKTVQLYPLLIIMRFTAFVILLKNAGLLRAPKGKAVSINVVGVWSPLKVPL